MLADRIGAQADLALGAAFEAAQVWGWNNTLLTIALAFAAAALVLSGVAARMIIAHEKECVRFRKEESDKRAAMHTKVDGVAKDVAWIRGSMKK